MSSDESEGFDLPDDDSGSEFEEDFAPKPKSKPKAAPKPKTKPASKPATKTTKAAAKPKTTTTKAKAKEPLLDRASKIPSDSDPEAEDEVPELPPKKSTTTAAASSGPKKSASQTYQKLTQLEHVLKRPDTYIGSVEAIRQFMWTFDKERKIMVNKEISFVPGLYKIVDEILVNAADNKQRDDNMDTLKVTIDPEKNIISVMNNGKGIPIEIHETEGIYIPELIFGHLLAGSNFDDEEKKTTGGRNGYGAKLANIYSTEFIVETADKATGKKYKQVFKDNMSKKEKPKITDNKKGEEFTKITFKPDLAKFNLPVENGLAGDMEGLLNKRVYDLAGTLKNVKVWLNDERIKITGFKKYVEMYTNGVNEALKGSSAKAHAMQELEEGAGVQKPTIIYEEFGKRWEVAFTPSDGQFQQVSFCNSIATTKGGTHVDHVVKQFVDKITEAANKKKTKVTLKPFQVKNHLWVFVNCLIENPAFDSQTKENMTLGVSKFGSKCVITEDFMKKVMKSGVIDIVVDFAKFKEEAAMKKTDGTKRSRITGIVKLEDANNAGTRKAAECTLILTEGDSAKSLAVAGLSVIGRDNYGVFPLRGKLLNVREAGGNQIINNTEIQHIKQIMGLQQGKTYTSRDSLRYGSLMIMTDQIPGFLVEFITPIVKATRKKEEISFFTMPEFERWKEENDGGREWKSKYYKGLGTSDAKDAKKYFSKMSSHRIKFAPAQPEERGLIDMAFSKKKADDRKEWLRGFEPGTFLNHNVSQITYNQFINKELILYSMADNIRSIPSMVDGFKPGQRKVLFACFKRKLKAEIKVAQLGGYCSEHSAYHHGEQSLTQTIVGLAQNFVGSNNIILLSPNGQFGTRASGGKDAASARYIFTNIEKITRFIFPPSDDHVLNYLTDDGMQIEPEWYVPILPMVLVNGSSGIGTGWSSDIPNYNPVDIVNNLRHKLHNEPMEPMHPWFRGFTGQIICETPNKYKVMGEWDQPDEDTIEITELPIRVWTTSYKEQLEAWIISTDKIPALIKDYREYHTETTVHFIITLSEKGKEAVRKDGIEKVFKLSGTLSTTNMVCFDSLGKIKRYTSPEEILDDFYDIRLAYYQKRKEFLVNDLTINYERLSNQARFVLMIIEKKLIVNNRKKADLVAELRKLEFRPFPKKPKAKTAGDPDQAGEEEEEQEEEVADLNASGTTGDYDYLLGMAISRLTAEQVVKLLAERDDKEKELQILLGKSAEDLWHFDLDAFEAEWRKLMLASDESRRASVKKIKGLGLAMTATSKAKGKKVVAKRELDSDGEEIYKPTTDKKPTKSKTATQTKLDLKSFTKPESNPEVLPTTETEVKKPSSSTTQTTKAGSSAALSKTTKAAPRSLEKRVPTDDSDEEKAKSKKPPAKKAKRPIVESDSGNNDSDDFTIAVSKTSKDKGKSGGKGGDDDDDDEIEIQKPKKKLTTTTTTTKGSKPTTSKTTKVGSSTVQPKKKGRKPIGELTTEEDSDIEMMGTEEDEEENDKKKKQKNDNKQKKTKPSSKKVSKDDDSDSESEDFGKLRKSEKNDEGSSSNPARRPARAKQPVKYIIDDDDDDEEEGSESD